MRSPSLDALEELFLARWTETDRDLRACLETVKAAVVLGMGRARARASADGRVRQRRQLSTHRQLVETHVVVIERVARVAGVEVGQLIGSDRSRTASRARAWAAWALYRVRKLSYPEVAAITRRRDHTSAMWCVRKVDAEVASDPRLGAKLRRLAAS